MESVYSKKKSFVGIVMQVNDSFELCKNLSKLIELNINSFDASMLFVQ